MPDKGVAGPRLSKLGRYEVLNELGKGAMGIVYLAKDPVIGRMVAIKTIRTSSFGEDDSESREFRERFIREAQTAGILSHPNIVTIHDIGEDPDTQTSFIAMEYIEGRNLKSLLAEKTKFAYEQIADLIAQVAEAIDYAHRKGIIHRDIKPANIIITLDNKVKIMDFGIAKIASSNLTTTGQFLGTPNYMSPEQVSGAAVDGRSDIFSLGVVLYELLTSRKPFQGENLTAISYKIVHEEFTPPADLSPEVPPDFNAIVARAMAKDPWNRYQRGKDLALALHQLKARLEEQRALRDLGSMVSAAENMPTLRLENLGKAAADAERAAVAAPGADSDQSDWTEDSGAGSGPRFAGSPAGRATPPADASPRMRAAESLERPSDAQTRAIPIVTNLPPPAEGAPPAGPAADPGIASTAASDGVPPSESAPAAGSLPPTQPLPTAPPRAVASLLRFVPASWKPILEAEVNKPYFWGLAIAAAFFVIVVAGAIVARAAIVSRPTAPMDLAVEKEALDRKHALDEGKKLFSAGKYEQSLALLRQVLARSPGNQQARQYAQMAENALAGRAEEARKSEEAEKSLEAARAAMAAGNFEEVVQRADETLALDGGKVEAQQLRDQASEKIAQAKAVEADAARKKKEEKRLASARKPAPAAAAPASKAAEKVVPTPAVQGPVATGPATLTLHFESPINDGNLIVYVNGERAIQKSFDFSKKAGFFKRVDGTGTIEEKITVKPGPAEVKVWLSGKGLNAAVFTSTTAQLSAGETRTLRLDFSGGQLAAKIQ
jgi:serine/threonine-protein kinase